MKAYTATKRWRDGFGADETRIMAADLIRIEEGISAATQGVTDLEGKVSGQPGEILRQVQKMTDSLKAQMDLLVPVGTIAMYGSDADPEGWLRCDGRTVSRSDYPKLFALLGIRFGSTTVSDFKVPDFRERSPIGAGGGGKYSINDKGGNTTINLSINQMPPHTHRIGEVGNAANRFTARTANQDIGIGTSGYTYLTSTGTSESERSPIATSAGSGDPVDIRHPYIGSIFIIRAK